VGSLTMQGKTCLVTGATSGIGQALAVGLARQGATVVLLARDPAASQATLARLNQAGGSAHDLRLATDPEFREASGRFCLRAREISPPPYTLDESVQERLWSVSESLVGLRYSF